jgi:hypothetical protein
MSKRNASLKTKVGKGPVIFTITGLVSSIAVITLIAIYGLNNPFGIVAIIFFGIIAVVAIILMFGLLLDYAYIDGDTLYMQYIFKSSKIKLKDVGSMVLKNNIYTIYDKLNNEVGTINSIAIGADKIIIALDKAGAKIK